MVQSNFSCAFLGNRNHRGYGWVNYNRNENELSIIAKKIYAYQFKRECLEIKEGAGSETILEYPEWEERCKSLFSTFFSRGASSGIILFPDVEIPFHNQIRQAEIWKRIMITLNNWCKKSSPKDATRRKSSLTGATGLIIRNYNLKDHLYFRGIEEDEIKDTLGFNSSGNMFDFQESDTRFFVFNPSRNIILIIRLIELQEGDPKLLKKEVDHCIDEVNLLCFLLRDELENTGVIVTGLVAYSGENAHSQSACEDCDNIVSFEIFNSVKTFKGCLKRFFKRKKIEDLKIHVARNLKKDKINIFQAVASKILGYLSHLQFKMLEQDSVAIQEPVLPVTEQDATDNIKQAELLLNCYQMEIAYSDDKRIWLEGNYGTGKTIVALKKLELLLKALKAKEVIYYVSFARSLLYLKIKQRFEKYKNVKAIRGEYSLSDTIKHQILWEEREIGTKNIHLIVDEYSSQDLSTKEVKSLIPILNEEKELANSTVFIAVQPIKINRVEKICENGIKRELSKTKHALNKLVKATGIQKRTLENVMRTTVQINNLAEITREYLDKQSNRCVYHAVRSDYKEVKNFNSSFQSRTPESNVPSSATSDYSSNGTTTSLSSSPEKLIDYDEIYKLVHTEINADEENFREAVTSYSYTCDSQIGHEINGPLPQFIKFSESADLCEQVALIALVLDKIIEPEETKPNRIAVIHFEPDDPPLWLKSLFQLENISPSLKVTNDTEKFLKDDNKSLALVKNLKFLRGLEFSKVLLILDSDEHHLRHLIPEAIARCMSNLTVLIRPPVHGIHKSNTVADLADEWEKNLDSGILTILKIGFCLEPSCNEKKVQRETYCESKIMYGSSYRVHKNCKSYKNFLRAIKRKKIRNVQPEYKDKRREAEAL